MSRLLRPSRYPRVLRSRLAFPPQTTRPASSFLQNAPAPPRLPPDQQAEFERLQSAAEAALSSHNNVAAAGPGGPAPPELPGSASPPPLSTSRHVSMPTTDPAQAQAQAATLRSQPHSQSQSPPAQTTLPSAVAAAGTLSGGIRQGAPPEFEGDKNPRTGEVGGPKNEPLRWGSGSDWSFNGRVTDF